jgi:putative two-component system response regulator
MNKRVLVIDDQETNRLVLEDLLEDEYEVQSAENGEQGLDILKVFGPDIVLLDVMMPGLNGYEVCRRIKEMPGGEFTPVLLVSAKSELNDRLQGYAVGADDYVVKPFDHDELLAKLRTHFRLRGTLLELASTRAKLAVQNADLETLVQERTADVVATRDVTVFALAKLAESRDPETGEHLERMRAYSQILAEHLNEEGPYTDQIDEQFLDDLYRSSPLHDIGKVGIPDVILLKPGRLSQEEFDIMKRHATIGADALAMAAGHTGHGGFLTVGADIARCHHERFDGTGYPNGLTGQAIPLAARIVALADVYDALTSVRVYKAAFEPIVARSMIEEQSGRHFDPAVVEAFVANWERFLVVPAQVAKAQQPVESPELVDALF